MSRKERDSLGERELPDRAYYGVQTLRALENFPVSGLREPDELVKAYVLVKKASAMSNMELGVLDRNIGEAIVKAANEVLEGSLRDQFVVDVYQAGAGTSFNMNVNEVLANRALELLGKEKGDHSIINPNDHVNMAQSTNDTFPTASHIAIIMAVGSLMPVLKGLAQAFEKKGKENKDIPKSGRTHLMDALPVTLGYELGAYGTAIERAMERISQRRDDLLELPMGGTATGTGANAHARFRETVLTRLSDLTGYEVLKARDSFEALQSRSQMAAMSSALKELALELIRIANDLRLLASGPTTGLAEIQLPAVQPGSSIMAGKVNPVMAECMDMVAFQVIGNDTTVALAAQAGQIDLNVMTPVMIYNILSSIHLLRNYIPSFTQRAVMGITANEARCRAYLEMNPSLATLLNPRIGYLRAAVLAKEALDTKVPVVQLALEKGLISEEEARTIFDPKKVTKSKYD